MEYHYISTLKTSDKGDVQLVAGDKSRLYVRRYREISPELFARLKNVSSPLIERLAERSEDENGSFFTSEYIKGETADSRELSEKEAYHALLELCDALRALHKKGIIHRDVKPSNMLFTQDGHIRLIDFDSARLTIQYQSRDTELLGTEGYAAPEQYGFMQTDGRADIYAFGVTMRELLGDSADKPSFRHVIKRCTELDPDRRYQNIRAVKRALKLARIPFIPPLTVTAAATAAAVILLVRKAPTPAPMGIVRLSGTSEISVTIEAEVTSDDSTETLPTAEPTPPTAETPPTTEPAPTTESTPAETVESIPAETTATTPTMQTAVTTSAPSLTEEPPAEVTATVEENLVPTVSEAEPAARTAEETTVPETTATSPPEEPAPERTPLILSDSINPNRITFETILDEEGMYRDVFEYVFYDDPAVHGEWRAYGVLMPDMDFTMLSVNDLRYNESMKDMLWQYLSVDPNGTIITYDQNKKPYSVNLWTNGYHIKPDKNRQYVCRMFAVTLEDGNDYLLYEQKPTGNYRWEVPHRYLIYKRIE